MAADKMVMHNVFFTLKEQTPAGRQQLIDACTKYLNGHPGVRFFAVGVRANELNRPVNDRDFDVALHILFTDQAAHDRYQEAPRHVQFVEENKDNWKNVRVFDSAIGE